MVNVIFANVEFANEQVEDLSAAVTVNCFPRVYADVAGLLGPDRVVRIDGRLDRRDDGSVSITANAVKAVDLNALADPDSVPVVLQAREEDFTRQRIESLKEALRENSGPSPVHLRLVKRDGKVTVLALGPELTVRRGPALTSSVKTVLGLGSVVDDDL